MEKYPNITKDKFYVTNHKKMNREEFFNDRKPLDVDFNEEYMCHHCEKKIKASEYKVLQEKKGGYRFIVCPNAPECDGTLIDWDDL